MKKIIVLLFVLLIQFTFGQVGIGTKTPEKGSVLDVNSNDKAVLLTRVANTAAIKDPVEGMLIYDMSRKCIRTFEKMVWSDCLSKKAPEMVPQNVAINCDDFSFGGNYTTQTAVVDGYVRVKLVNNTFSNVKIALSESDITFFGAPYEGSTLKIKNIGTTALGTDISTGTSGTITLAPFTSKEAYYNLTGSPSEMGTLEAKWENPQIGICKSTTKPAMVMPKFSCNQAITSPQVVLSPALGANLTAMSIGQPFSGNYVVKYDGGDGITEYAAYSETQNGITVEYPKGVYAKGSGTIVYTLSGNLANNTQPILFKTPTGCNLAWSVTINTGRYDPGGRQGCGTGPPTDRYSITSGALSRIYLLSGTYELKRSINLTARGRVDAAGWGGLSKYLSGSGGPLIKSVSTGNWVGNLNAVVFRDYCCYGSSVSVTVSNNDATTTIVIPSDGYYDIFLSAYSDFANGSSSSDSCWAADPPTINSSSLTLMGK